MIYALDLDITHEITQVIYEIQEINLINLAE